MDQPCAVEPHAGQVWEVGEVQNFPLFLVIWGPVTADRQNRARALVYCNHVWTCNAVRIVEWLGQINVHVHLEDHTAGVVLIALALARHFFVFLVDIRQLTDSVGQVNLAVEPNNLKLFDLIVGFLHHVGVAGAGLEV